MPNTTQGVRDRASMRARQFVLNHWASPEEDGRVGQRGGLSFVILCTSVLFEIQKMSMYYFCNWTRGGRKKRKRRGREGR